MLVKISKTYAEISVAALLERFEHIYSKIRALLRRPEKMTD